MRKNFQDVAFYPQPVLVVGTYDEAGVPNAMNVAWGGLVGSKYVELNISAGHKTTENLRKTGAFTVAFATRETLVPADYVGLVSGRTVPDKVERAGLKPVKGDFVNAPVFLVFPVALECRVEQLEEKGPGGVRVIGQVVNLSADESALGQDGRVDLDKLEILTYDRLRRIYRVVGEAVGQAYHDGRALMEG